MRIIHYIAIGLAAFLVTSCLNRQGGRCDYVAFDEHITIKSLQQDYVVTSGSVIDVFNIKDFDKAPQIGEHYRAQGKQLIKGSCTPIIELQIAKDK